RPARQAGTAGRHGRPARGMAATRAGGGTGMGEQTTSGSGTAGSGEAAGGGGRGGGRRGGLFDDLAGIAGGAFSALAGLRSEMEAAARSQAEAMIQRFDLVGREELDAAMEVARRAREEAEALAARVAALETRLGVAGRDAPPAATMT